MSIDPSRNLFMRKVYDIDKTDSVVKLKVAPLVQNGDSHHTGMAAPPQENIHATCLQKNQRSLDKSEERPPAA